MNKNNKGLSLVELIISILILMIIFIPAITGFNTSLKATQRAEDISYAENAAATVLEEIKYVGIKQVMDLAAHSEQNWTKNEDDILCPYYSLANAPGGVYREGNEEFQVRVYFDSTEYNVPHGANDYPYADLGNFASSESVVLNPGVMGDNYDQVALDYFIEQYDQYAMQIDAERWRNYNAFYNEVVEWNDDHKKDSSFIPTPLPTRPPDVEVPSKRLSGVSLACFQDCIIKSANVILVPNKIDNGDGTFTYQMRLTSRMVYIFDNDKADLHLSDPNYTVNGFHFHCNNNERVFSGFCENAVYVNVKSVYILYTPISDDLSCDMVTIINGNEDPDQITSVYVIIQADEDKEYTDSEMITIDIPDTDSYGNPLLDGEGNVIENHAYNLRVLCQAKMKYAHNEPKGTLVPDSNGMEYRNRLLKDEDTTYDRISSITVKVLPADCTAAAGSPEEDRLELASLVSTVLQ